MIVIYKELENQPKFNINDNIISLVSENHWFLDSFHQRSIYFGYWVEIEEKIYKILERININDEIKYLNIINEREINLICSNNKINLFLDSQGLNLNSLNPIFLDIDVDFRVLYETGLKGENFRIIPNENLFVIITDKEIDINFYYEGELKFINQKYKLIYDYDKKRNSSFTENEVIKIFKGWIRNLKIFCSKKTPENNYFFNDNFNSLEAFILKRIFSLYTKNNGFRAGLPWFPQRWFRDELISLLFLNLNENLKEKILNYYLDNLENIWKFNKEKDNILTSDTLPLIIINLSEDQLKKEFKKILSLLKEWDKLFSIYKDNLLPKSTWMDSIERKRALELDFLYYLSLLKLNLINEAKKFKIFIKKKIFENKYPHEEFFRPNIFFAYFLVKDFFEKEEWENFFDKIIEENYLHWGGFSSINKKNIKFTPSYSGENPKSYHQGDSWFWLNNLAIFALSDLNKEKYNFYIKKLKEAEMKNLLKMGVPGFMSELSSAADLKYEASPIQLWSLTSLFYNIKRNGGRSSIG
ncbi:MAG: hypothetical protein NZ866_01455 [Patescibacteria group bacterium]|nr:hypothetical protein [Patescibacteria group bacterium]